MSHFTKEDIMIVIVGTLDTKGDKIAYLKKCIEKKGEKTLVIDCGVIGNPSFEPDISNEKVAESAGNNLVKIRAIGRRSEAEAMRSMAKGVSKIVKELYANGMLECLLGIGGTMGTSFFLSVAADLPYGIPKIIVCTTAFSSYLRVELIPADLIVIPDISVWGTDVLSKRSLDITASIACEAGRIFRQSGPVEKSFIGIDTLGTSALKYVIWLKPLLEKVGKRVICIHSAGGQGWAFEGLIKNKLVEGVFYLCLLDLIPEGLARLGFLSTPQKFESAVERDIPLIVAPGDVCEVVWPKAPEDLPAKFNRRKSRQHNDLCLTIERSMKEVIQTAELVATKLNRGKGPRGVVVPMQGTAAWDLPGQRYFNPKRVKVFAEALKAAINSNVKMIELDCHINDKLFAEEAFNLYRSLSSG